MTRTANELRDELQLAISLLGSCRLDAQQTEVYIRLHSRFQDNEGALVGYWLDELKSDDE